MPVLPNGIEYQVVPYFGGSNSYSEMFVRDGSQIVALLRCKWEEAGDFKAGVRGYTEVDTSGASPVLTRVPPLLCPFTDRKYAERLELVAWGNDRLGVDSHAEWATNLPGASQLFYQGHEEDEYGWFTSGFCIYRVTFTKPPFLLVDTDENAYVNGEWTRYTKWEDMPRIRELKRPDLGFETDEASPTPIALVGFAPDVEREIRVTWYQVPWGYVPHQAIADNALAVNSATFYGHAPGTLRFDGVTNIETPYEDADGGLYVDPVYIFRKREIANPDDPAAPFGWNYIRTSRIRNDGRPEYVKLRQKGWQTGQPKLGPYREVSTFGDLFAPEVP